jgi:hypothetical protein
MSYQEYLSRTGQKDSRTAWKWWKIETCGMSEKQAIKAAYDPEWGYKPIAERAGAIRREGEKEHETMERNRRKRPVSISGRSDQLLEHDN